MDQPGDDYLDQHPMVKDLGIIAGGAWLTQQRRNDPLYQDTKYKGDTQNMRSYNDWCAYRKDSRCHYPKDFDVEATAQAPPGYSVWKAEDRGYCPRRTADEQKTCPVGAPGPDSGDPHAIPAANITDAYYQIKTS